MANCMKLYDVVRIDHFRGFDEYYSIPYGDKTAEFGHWEKGPGMDLFRALEKNLGKLDVIAEDLGLLTDSVIEMVEESGFPGMKVLQLSLIHISNRNATRLKLKKPIRPQFMAPTTAMVRVKYCRHLFDISHHPFVIQEIVFHGIEKIYRCV